MEYVVSLRTALNDVKAVLNLEPERKARVAPLMNVRGDDDKQVSAFLDNWGDSPFLLEVSRFLPDQHDLLIVNGSLHSPEGGYAAKRAFYDWATARNSALIPVVSWANGDPTREVVQCAVQLERQYRKVAVIVDMNSGKEEIDKITRILDAIDKPENLLIILSVGEKSPPSLGLNGELFTLIAQIKAYGINRAVLLSTAFPSDKPPSGTSRVVTCLDLVWQKAAQKMMDGVEFIYGDFGTTNPTSPLEYIPGMPVIPFASVLINSEWYQIREGKDKEFFVYPNIAASIRSLPGYQGDEFCWAAREIARIASKTDNKYGNNGTWNGYRINQHICAALTEIGGVMPGSSEDAEDI
jgi:hypothetical protein